MDTETLNSLALKFVDLVVESSYALKKYKCVVDEEFHKAGDLIAGSVTLGKHFDVSVDLSNPPTLLEDFIVKTVLEPCADAMARQIDEYAFMRIGKLVSYDVDKLTSYAEVLSATLSVVSSYVNPSATNARNDKVAGAMSFSKEGVLNFEILIGVK